MEPVVIRRLEARDAEVYMAFRIAALAASPLAFTSTPADESERPISRVIERIQSEANPKNFVVGAFLAGQLVGVAGFNVPLERQARHKGRLFGMAVSAPHAGQGIGRAIVERLKSEARDSSGARQIVLTVSQGNDAAEGLFRSCGFEEFGREPRAVIVDGVDVVKIHMICMLD